MNSTLSNRLQLADCYRILNVTPRESWEAVRKSYKALARKHHPDLNPGCYDQRIQEITAAYRILETHFRSVVREEVPTIQEDSATRERSGGKTMLHRILFGARPKPWRMEWSRLGRDVEKDMEVDAATAAQGGRVRVRRSGESFDVNLPPGGWREMRLRVPGKGEPGLLKKKRGDLLLNIRVRRQPPGEPVFYYDISVARSRIAEGRVMTLDSNDGPIRFFLPRSVRDGESFILKSRPGKGDASASHVVTVRLV